MKAIYLIKHGDLFMGKKDLGLRELASLFTLDDAVKLCVDRWGLHYRKHVDIIEASATDWMRAIGRKGGSRSSTAKTLAVRINAKRKRGKKMEDIIRDAVNKVLEDKGIK